MVRRTSKRENRIILKNILDIDVLEKKKESINATSMTDTYRYEITSWESGYTRVQNYWPQTSFDLDNGFELYLEKTKR